MPDAAPLDRLLQEKQADLLPSVAASVVHKGEIVWSNAVGDADYGAAFDATPGTQYGIGSITKTVTATSIMQLRDARKLDLDERLGQHLDGSPRAKLSGTAPGRAEMTFDRDGDGAGWIA